MARFKATAAAKGRNFREHIEYCLELGERDFPGKITQDPAKLAATPNAEYFKKFRPDPK